MEWAKVCLNTKYTLRRRKRVLGREWDSQTVKNIPEEGNRAKAKRKEDM